MKSRSIFTLVVFASFLAINASSSFAAKPKKEAAKAAESSIASSSSSSSSGPKAFGVGVSSIDSQGGATGASASGIFELNDSDAIQALFAIHSTSPFAFTLGGIFKHTVSGNRNTGFHVGGGLALGTSGGGTPTFDITTGNATGGGSKFVINIIPNAGFHFTMPGLDKVLWSFDLGPVIAIRDGNAQFGITPFSSLLGLSVHYMF